MKLHSMLVSNSSAILPFAMPGRRYRPHHQMIRCIRNHLREWVKLARAHRSAYSLSHQGLASPVSAPPDFGGSHLQQQAAISLRASTPLNSVLPTRRGLIGKNAELALAVPSALRRVSATDLSPTGATRGALYPDRRQPGHRSTYSVAPVSSLESLSDLSAQQAAHAYWMAQPQQPSRTVGADRSVSGRGKRSPGKHQAFDFVISTYEAARLTCYGSLAPPSIAEETPSAAATPRLQVDVPPLSATSTFASTEASQFSSPTVSPTHVRSKSIIELQNDSLADSFAQVGVEDEEPTPRSSVDFYAMGRNESMDAVWRDRITDWTRATSKGVPRRVSTKRTPSNTNIQLQNLPHAPSSATVSRFPSLSLAYPASAPPWDPRFPQAGTQTLLWTYAQLQGTFEVDEMLIKPAEFIAVKRALVVCGDIHGSLGLGASGSCWRLSWRW